MQKVNFQDYGYINARIRAMWSELLSKDFFEKLLRMDFLDIVTALGKTSYQREIEEWVIKKGESRAVDEVFKRNLSRTFEKIKHFMGQEAEELTELLLGRFDVHNLKTILRGIHWNLGEKETVTSLLPAGQLNEVLLQELAKQTDIKSFTDLLTTWKIPFVKPLKTTLPLYSRSKDLVILEAALEKYYYTYALEKLRSKSYNSTLIRELLATGIDVSNIITLFKLQKVDFPHEARRLRAKRRGEEANEETETRISKPQIKKVKTKRFKILRTILRFTLGRKQPKKEEVEDKEEKELKEIEDQLKRNFFIPGGKEINEKRFLDLASKKGVEEIIRGFEDTSYAKALDESMGLYRLSGQISVLERALEEFTARKGVKIFRVNPFSIGVVAGYIAAKLNEVVNLRIILIGKSMEMPREQIREKLILI